MEYFAQRLLLLCCLFMLGVSQGVTENPIIQNCINGSIDIQENANNTIICKGFTVKDSISWTVRRPHGEGEREVAECNAGESVGCRRFDFEPEHFVAERNGTHGFLFYKQYDRSQDENTQLSCRRNHGTSSQKQEFCDFNVINPAALSGCVVQEDRYAGLVQGSCSYTHAYSFKRPFKCTWYREAPEQEAEQIDGVTSEAENGKCHFSTELSFNANVSYSYSIDFYPGTGLKMVDNVTQFTAGPPLAAIAGGAAGAVFVVVVGVVSTVLVKRRRHIKANSDDDYVEHINELYGTSEPGGS